MNRVCDEQLSVSREKWEHAYSSERSDTWTVYIFNEVGYSVTCITLTSLKSDILSLA
jgi:hypothetical protein